MKDYLLDTNALLSDPNIAERYIDQGDRAVLHPSVLIELDRKKTERGLLGLSARQAIRSLDDLVDRGKLYVPSVSSSQYADPDLHSYMSDNQEVTLVTNDRGLALRVKAQLGVERVIGCETIKPHTDSLFGAYRTLPSEAFVDWESGKAILTKTAEEDYNLKENQYLIFESMLAQYDARNKQLNRIIPPRNGYGITPLNAEQKLLMHMLYDSRIDIGGAVGIAGCGKTLLTLAAGLDQVREGRYEKVMVFRPLVTTGKDPGTLPGDLMDKVGDYFKPIYDNLNFIFRKQRKIEGQRVDTQDVQKLLQEGKLEFDIMAKVRGRTFRDAYVILDEAQNLTPSQMKTLITRVGQNSRIVLTGDPYQIDLPNTNENNNGLTHVVRRFIGQDNFSFVELKESKRSRLAEQAANLL